MVAVIYRIEFISKSSPVKVVNKKYLFFRWIID